MCSYHLILFLDKLTDPLQSVNNLEQMEYTLKLLRKSLLRHSEPNWVPDSKNSDFQGDDTEVTMTI